MNKTVWRACLCQRLFQLRRTPTPRKDRSLVPSWSYATSCKVQDAGKSQGGKNKPIENKNETRHRGTPGTRVAARLILAKQAHGFRLRERTAPSITGSNTCCPRKLTRTGR